MTFRRAIILCSLLLLPLGVSVACAEERAYEPQSSYAVLISDAAFADPAWRAVAAALRDKHAAALIIYPIGKPETALPELQRLFPSYACLVAPPEETPRAFVVAVHRLMRRLDDDPYTDLLWGILTGYDAADALRIAKHAEPLAITRAASSMGPGVLKGLAGGFASNETNKADFWHQEDGGETVHETVAPDAIAKLVQYFNAEPPHMFHTSGHATEQDWQTYYNIRGGQFRCQDGQLYGLDSDNRRYDIHSPAPKIYMPMGNCLIGHIPGRDCMATAWMHTGGAYQMFGYTAVTFFGYMGWGVGTYFGNPWDLAEAFHFNNQALVHELVTHYPDKASIQFDQYDAKSAATMAAKHGITDRKLLGYLWDRDVVAFYGDPAWQARRPGTGNWTYAVDQRAENVTVSVTSLADGKWPNRPLFVPFKTRLRDFRSVETEGLGDAPVVLTDRFLLLPIADHPRAKGATLRVRFGARPIEAVPTSAADAPLRVSLATTEQTAETPGSAVALEIPRGMRRRIAAAFAAAGDNRGEIERLLQSSATPPEFHDALFLIANMPQPDLQRLTASYLCTHIGCARRARREAPWGTAFDDDVFRNYVLPYASLTEPREDWRERFHADLMPRVKACATAPEAALLLNATIYDLYDVHYDATKRSRPDQGPLAAMAETFASCTGLSILLVDACRSVAVPARIAGVAQWTHSGGNHTWVEIMAEDGAWHALGASESKALGDVWFAKAASEVDATDPFKRIYASTFQRSTLKFPLAWSPYNHDVNAIDRTDAYRNRTRK